MRGPARKRLHSEHEKDFRRENQALRRRLAEAEQTIQAIRSGAVDAVVVSGPDGEQVYTIAGAERPYRTLVETMHAGAVTLDVDGTILYANARFADMVGLPLERLAGAPFDRLLAPEDMTEFASLLVESRSRGSTGEVHLRPGDGRDVPVNVALRFLDGPDVQATCMVVTDLSERKRSEEARREAERRYHDLFERSPVAVFRGVLDLVTKTGTRLEINDAYVRLFGYASRQEALSDPVTRIFAPGEWDRYIGELLEKRVLTGYEMRFRRLDGTPLAVLMSATCTERGDGTAMVEGTILDISQRKQAEEALRRLPEVLEQQIEERTIELSRAVEQLQAEIADRQRAEEERRILASFPEQNPYPSLRVTRDGVLRYVNPAGEVLCDLWRVRPGKPLPAPVREVILAPLATGTAREIELPCGERIFALMCSPAGGYVNVYGRDITQRKRIQEHQERLVKDLEAVNRELNEFAYVVSHDLKAPLRAITSLAGWLRRDYAEKLGGEGAAQLALLEGRAKRLNALIDGVLEYSRVGRATEKKSLVDLDQVVAEVIDLLSPPASVRIRLADALPKVSGARVALQQVFQNLLQNAIKFNDKPDVQIAVACRPVPGFWQFSVTDNGPGIPDRHSDKIFQMFRTLAPRDKVESTGIGLALAKKIVEVHGGRIWVTSREGEGATFHFTLPRDEA